MPKPRENLCDFPLFTGYTRDGGYATHTIAEAAFVFPLPEDLDPVSMAPLLCAGLIGWRSLKGRGRRPRRSASTASAPRRTSSPRSACGRAGACSPSRGPGDAGLPALRALARRGHGRAGSDEKPPVPLDAAILFAPVGALVPAALGALRKGGRVVCGGIHMSDIPSFPYSALWEERSIASVANLTREDGREFLEIAPQAQVKTTTTRYPLEKANEALDDLRHGRLEGAAVLVP